MAFKNEDLAIHLSETFEQDIWAANTNELFMQRLYMNERVRRWNESPKGKAYHKERWKKPEVLARHNEWRRERRALLAQERPQREPPTPEEIEARKERERERKRKNKAAAYARNRNDPAYMAKRAEENRIYQAKKRAERLAAQQQPETNPA